MKDRKTYTPYEQGFRNGRLDMICGLTLQVALRSPDKDYARGYADGQEAGQEYRRANREGRN